MELDSKAEPVVRKAGYFNTLFRGLLVLLGLPALALVLHFVLPLGLSMTIVLLCCYPSVLVMRGYGATGFGLALLAVCVSAATLSTLDESKKLNEGPRARDVSLSEARASTDAVAFYFKDVTLQRELLTEYRYKTSGKNPSTRYQFVAPLTGLDWTEEEPVEAWVVTSSFQRVQQWNPALQTGIRLNETPTESNALGRCLRKAEEKHGLNSVSEPLLLRWKDPDVKYEEDMKQLKSFLLGSIIFWLLAWTIYWVTKGRKN